MKRRRKPSKRPAKGKSLKGLAILTVVLILVLIAVAHGRNQRNAIKGMAYIPAGSFMMGEANEYYQGEQPVHDVYLDAFYIDKYEVTQGQYVAFCEATGRARQASYGAGKGDYPVDNISWNDAKAYCKWKKKRLPTEAEWEKACRAGSDSRWCFGDDENMLGKYAWFDANSREGVHPVGEKLSNRFGVYDMHGNVDEWCADWYGEKYYFSSPSANPTGPINGTERVVRGGRFHHSGGKYAMGALRSSYRDYRSPEKTESGCRCVKTP